MKSFHTNTHSLCSCGTFHVFNFIVTYLSLLQFAPWIVGRPHCGCWGHKGDNGSPLGLLWWKRHAAAGVLPRLQHWFYTVVLFHTGWINGRRQKDKSPFFPLFLRSFFFLFGTLKNTNQRGKVTFDITFLDSSLSLPEMMWGLWQRSPECVTLSVSDVIV